VDVYNAPDQQVRLEEGQSLDGGDVLPGFVLPLSELFTLPGSAGQKKRPRGKNGKTNGR